jgi:metallo-beta-lactamase class B
MKAEFEKMKSGGAGGTGGANPFIDPVGYKAYVVDREAAFRKEWERQK